MRSMLGNLSRWRVAHSRTSRLYGVPFRGAKSYSSTSAPSRPSASPSRNDCSSDGVLRLMPLGESVTRGVGSSHGTGYRNSLLKLLKSQEINARMVGSRKDGTMPNNEHEGWRGFRIDQIEKKAKKSVRDLSPDVFMVNAGSNDCLQKFDIATAGERMSRMLDFLWEECPHSTILLSTLIVSADKQVDLVVRDFNGQYRELAEKMAMEQKRIVLVDMYSSDGPDAHTLVDGIHPDDGGYEKMADLWLRGIQEAIEREFIDPSKYRSGAA